MFAGIFAKLSQRRPAGRSNRKLSQRKLESAARIALEPLENRAYMSFTAPVSYPAASSTVAMVTADVNNDAKCKGIW